MNARTAEVGPGLNPQSLNASIVTPQSVNPQSTFPNCQ